MIFTRNKENNKFIYFLINGILIMLCCFLNNSIITDYVCAIIFIQFYIVSLFFNIEILWKYIFLHYYISTGIISVFLCDTTKVYLYELCETTSFSGAFPILAFFYWIFFTFLIVFDKKTSIKIDNKCKSIVIKNISLKDDTVFKLTIAFIFMIGLVFFALVAKKPAFLYGIDRFSYAKMYLPKWMIKLHLLPMMISPLLVVCLIKNKNYSMIKKFKVFIITYLPYILYEIWIGQRFQSFFMLIWSSMPLIIDSLKNKKISFKKQIGIICTILIILFGFVFLYSHQRNTEIDKLLSMRLVEQGQLWWKLYSNEKNNNTESKDIMDEINAIINSIFDKGESKDFGVYRLMYLTTPRNVVIGKLSTGSRYASLGFELAYYYCGYIGIIIVALFGAKLFTILSNCFIYNVERGNIVLSMIYLRILQKSLSAYCQGDWHSMFSTSSLICYCVIIMVALFKRKRINKKAC